ncbi:hypothetical protein [Nostoc sp. UHCC 0870]|uniref:hypothetical protein n=1 Tax=Nostoc sp. UHCC 0870 TaxID=2914041 RepID=UPI0030D8921E
MSDDKPQALTHLILHSQQQRCLRQAAPTPSQHHHSAFFSKLQAVKNNSEFN